MASAGLIRNENSMLWGLCRLKDIKLELEEMEKQGELGKAALEWFSVEEMIMLGKIIIKAALSRKENCGCHFRKQ